MITRLQSPIIAAVIGVVLYGLVTWLALNPAGVAREATVVKEPREERSLPLVPSWEYRNPDLDQMLAEIKEERELLRTRAKDLEHLKARIEAEWQERGVIDGLSWLDNEVLQQKINFWS